MARNPSAALLDVGDLFPRLELTLVDGRRLTVPDGLPRAYNVVLINRGAWCPFCIGQLRAFQAGLGRLAEEGIGVLSITADARDQALAMVAEHQLGFPVACGAPVERIADALGVYYEPHPPSGPPHFHAAGFVLGPAGTVLLGVYSSGAIGRLVWQDVLGYVKYVRSHP